ncbi:MAG: hypothetical protein ABSC46_02000 [Candidatus Limnocylindrales bacterium]|jgi:type III restriction enzyme
MPSVVIENPILNSPFREPTRHFRFDEDGITSEIADGRRRSTYFIPIPKPKLRAVAPVYSASHRSRRRGSRTCRH